MGQRTDRQVAQDAARFNATRRDLEQFLRSRGVRNVHTSPKAREAIRRASIRKLQAKANKPLEDALDTLREAETEAERFARLEPQIFAGLRAPSIAGRG